MKKLILLLCFIPLGGTLFGQVTDSTKININLTIDSTDEEDDDKDFNINYLSLGKKNVKTRFLLLDLGVNSYHNEGNPNLPASLKTFELRHSRSIEVNLHVYRQRIKIGNGAFNIEHGLSFDFNHYSFQNKVDYRIDSLESFYIDPAANIEKSRLFVSKMSLPLMLHFETNPKKLSKSFHFAAGAYAAVRLGANLRMKGSNRYKEKVADNFGLNDFLVGLRAEMGYGPVNLYATYSLMSMFKDGQGPNLTPFSVGFTVIPF
jgi:hypothetical protein